MLYWKHRQKIWTANTSFLHQNRRWAATWKADRMFSSPLCQTASLIKAPLVMTSLSKLLFKIIWGVMPDLDNSGRPRKMENSTRRFSNKSAKNCTRYLLYMQILKIVIRRVAHFLNFWWFNDSSLLRLRQKWRIFRSAVCLRLRPCHSSEAVSFIAL